MKITALTIHKKENTLKSSYKTFLRANSLNNYKELHYYIGNFSLVYDFETFYRMLTWYGVDMYEQQGFSALLFETAPGQPYSHTGECERLFGLSCNLYEDSLTILREKELYYLIRVDENFITKDTGKLSDAYQLASRGHSKIFFRFFGPQCQRFMKKRYSVIHVSIERSYSHSQVTYVLGDGSDIIIDSTNYPCHYKIRYYFDRTSLLYVLKKCHLAMLVERSISLQMVNLTCIPTAANAPTIRYSDISIINQINMRSKAVCDKKKQRFFLSGQQFSTKLSLVKQLLHFCEMGLKMML